MTSDSGTSQHIQRASPLWQFGMALIPAAFDVKNLNFYFILLHFFYTIAGKA